MDDAEARAVLREHGEEPPARGKLGPDWHTRADNYRQDGPGDDYDGGTSPADFETVADAPPEPVAGGQVVTPERPPRRPARARKPLRERLRGQQAKAGKRKPAHKRVPVDALISRGWELMGGLAGRVNPPVGKVLTMQAPVAGLVLEDVVRGTAADRVLQPLARAEERAEKVLALAAPPVLVGAIEAAQRLPEKEMQLRMAILVPMLEESLVLWVRIAGDKVDEMAARELETGPAREKARELLGMIFPQPVPAGPAPEPVPA
jgi:hypothetical protein